MAGRKYTSKPFPALLGGDTQRLSPDRFRRITGGVQSSVSLAVKLALVFI
jgi:hypothetical protein